MVDGSKHLWTVAFRNLDKFSILCKEGRVEEALETFEQRSILISRNQAYHLLQECTRKKDLEYGKRVQSLMAESGLDTIAVLGDHLIRLFASFGCLHESRQAFEKIADPSVYSWSSIISAHANLGQPLASMQLYTEMQLSGVACDKHVYLAALKACSEATALKFGRDIHFRMMEDGFGIDVIVGSTLVDMYAKCSSLFEAHKAFDQLPDKDIVSWNALIAGNAQDQGFIVVAFCEKMQEEGIKPNRVTFFSILKACGSIGSRDWGKHIHGQILKQGLETVIAVGNTILDMYGRCGSLDESHEVFHKLPVQDVVSWGAMIEAYVYNDECTLALGCFAKMQRNGIKPNRVTFLSALKACGSIGMIQQGKLIHCHTLKQKLGADILLANTLIDMYAKSACLEESIYVFHQLHDRNVVSWNALVAGYACDRNKHSFVLDCFWKMQEEGIKPNKVTFLNLLKVCNSVESLQIGSLIHNQILKHELECDADLGTALIDMYGKCGSFEKMSQVFSELPKHYVVPWNALIACYIQHGKGLPALNYFEQMQEYGINPDRITYMSMLKGCGMLGAVEKGRLIHDQIVKQNLEFDASVGNTLLDMYAKCGSLVEAQKVFNNLHSQDALSWGAIIEGYALCGEGFLALNCLSKMQKAGINPDKVITLSILLACTHAGLIDMGLWHFVQIKESYDLVADMDHHTCIVSLLGRAGCLIEAEDLLEAVGQPNLSGWKSLLNACRMHSNVELGRQCFDRIVRLDPFCTPGYIIMSNIYAEAQV